MRRRPVNCAAPWRLSGRGIAETRGFFTLPLGKNSMNKMSKMHKRVIAAHGALLALAALPVGAALAQTAQTDQPSQATQLQTVTVTAQRRAENIKDVPVSVSTIKGDKLDVLLSSGEDIRLLAAKVPRL